MINTQSSQISMRVGDSQENLVVGAQTKGSPQLRLQLSEAVKRDTKQKTSGTKQRTSQTRVQKIRSDNKCQVPHLFI